MNCKNTTKNCQHYIPDYNVGFKIVTPRKGDHYEGKKYANHSLVFILEGKVEFSYNDFLNRSFIKGELFFLPQAVEMYGTALTDAKLLILTFNSRVKSLCDNCCLADYSREIEYINYDFRPLKLTEIMLMYAQLMENYINTDIRCSFLHELKQKELFILMSRSYSQRELLELFYPIAGGNINFKSRVLENYREDISVKELAARFGISYSVFLRKFEAEFGMCVQEWRLKQKAKHIKLKLSIPSTTIADIIIEFNFSSPSHFTKFSKIHYGCTPTELIKNIRIHKNKHSDEEDI